MKLPRDEPAKNGRHINASVVVGAPPFERSSVIAELGMVEARFHIVRKGDRTISMNSLEEQSVKGRARGPQERQSSRWGLLVNISITKSCKPS